MKELAVRLNKISQHIGVSKADIAPGTCLDFRGRCTCDPAMIVGQGRCPREPHGSPRQHSQGRDIDKRFSMRTGHYVHLRRPFVPLAQSDLGHCRDGGQQ